MGYQFDELAKALAVETSRRGALRTVLLSLLGGVGLALTDRRAPHVAQAAGVPDAAPAEAVRIRPRADAAAPPLNVRFNQILCFNQVNFNGTIFFNQSCPDDPPGDENKPDSGKSLTPEQRHQRQRTNKSSPEDERLEGNVVAVNPDGQPPTITVANIDGNVIVVLFGDAAKLRQYIRVGDYVELIGQKIHELLFEALDLYIASKK